MNADSMRAAFKKKGERRDESAPCTEVRGRERDVTDSVVERKGPQRGRGRREPRTENNGAGDSRS